MKNESDYETNNNDEIGDEEEEEEYEGGIFSFLFKIKEKIMNIIFFFVVKITLFRKSIDDFIKFFFTSIKTVLSSILPWNWFFLPWNRPEKKPRIINVNEKNWNFKFANNSVTTAKYTLFSFLPKNIMEQFMRIANIYFAIISALQVLTPYSPTGKFGTIFPLIIVMTFQACKDLFEDIFRHIDDFKLNHSPAYVLRNGKIKKVFWKNVRVGDIIKVSQNNYFPADIICLSSSEKGGLCYVETSQLDGETNLKIKHALHQTNNLKTEEDFSDFKAKIFCQTPNVSLYTFKGNILIDDKKYNLDAKQQLLRGACLKNTGYIWGIVVYTGKQSKLMLNNKDPPHKRSKVEKIANTMIISLFGLVFSLGAFCSISYFIFRLIGGDIWYLDPQKTTVGKVIIESLENFITYFILFNNFIPISLYVSMETVKLFQAKLLMEKDISIFDNETNTPTRVKTSSLNEELGQVEFIFSDKTGTLTQNKMEFLKFSIDGQEYGKGSTEIGRANAKRLGLPIPPEDVKGAKKRGFRFNDDRIMNGNWKNQLNKNKIFDFLMLLAVCHSVIPEEVKKDDEDGNNLTQVQQQQLQGRTNVRYQAQSPDEGALVLAAKQLGFYFYKRTHDEIVVSVEGNDYSFKLLNVLEFNSKRKRSSVILKCPDGKIVLYTKGADNVIKKILRKNASFVKETTDKLEKFASEGLRTLLCAKTYLNPQDYDNWNKNYYIPANLSLDNRKALLDQAADLIEQNLDIVGATAIEDRLQEKVPDTIESLAKAGIKIWVLTGDKQETAINIGYACAMLDNNMKTVILNQKDKHLLRKQINQSYNNLKNMELKKKKNRKDVGLVIDGAALGLILGKESNSIMDCLNKKNNDNDNNGNKIDDEIEEEDNSLEKLKFLFLRLCLLCRSVICCRVSPLQKSLVVKLVRDNIEGAVTLSIGDGANDVPMIQEAHIGIGISGQEGLQAARAADYSFAQFKFLKRLLLVHGRANYRRMGKLILYSFYKNAIVQLTQLWFFFFNACSGSSLYDNTSYSAFNVTWTSIPIVILGILDNDVSVDSSLTFPQLYLFGQNDYYFNLKIFFQWMFGALYQSLIIFFIPFFGFQYSILYGGRTLNDEFFGLCIFTTIIIVVNLKIGFETSQWTIFPIAGLLLTFGMYLIYLLVVGGGLYFWDLVLNPNYEIPFWGVFDTPRSVFWANFFVPFEAALCVDFWLIILITTTVCSMKDLLFKAITRTFFRKLYHEIQEVDNATIERVESVYPKLKNMKPKKRRLYLFKKEEYSDDEKTDMELLKGAQSSLNVSDIQESTSLNNSVELKSLNN